MKKFFASILVTFTIVLLGSIAAFAEVSPTATTIPVPTVPPHTTGADPANGWAWHPRQSPTTSNGLTTPAGAQVGTTSVGLDGSNSGSVRTTPDGSVIAEDVRPDSVRTTPDGSVIAEDVRPDSVRTTPDGSVIAEDVRPDNTLASPKTGDQTGVLFLFSAAALLFSLSALIYKTKHRDTDIRFAK